MLQHFNRFLMVMVCGLLVAMPANGEGADVPASKFHFPATGVSVRGQAVLLAIDDVSLPIKSNLCPYLSKPTVHPTPVLTPSRDNPNAPDHLGAHFYGTVLRDQGKFRMWYYGVHYLDKPTDLHAGPVCYAESEDGVNWIKPILRQKEVKGSRDNNAIALPDKETWFAGVIKEPDESDPQRRYKMIYDTHPASTKGTSRTAVSPDGIHWTASDHFAIKSCIELSSFYKHNDLYIANGQYVSRSEGGNPTGRHGGAAVSVNFEDWIPGFADSFRIREPRDPALRGHTNPYDQAHLGVGATSLGNVAVGLFGLWHNAPGDESRKVAYSWFGHNTISCDLSLVVSNDGLHFREPVKGHVYISRHDSPVTPVEGTPIPTILIQSGNGILNVGDETWIYHGRWRNADYGLNYYAEVALATLPRDRWGALGLYPKAASGNLWSTAVTLPENDIAVVLNADGAHGLRVDIADEDFNLLPEYSGKNGSVVNAEEGLDCPVTWGKNQRLSLAGQTVRLRIQFTRSEDVNPRLFGVYLRDAD